MVGEELLGRIAVDPGVAFGKPTVKGTRITVGRVLELLAGGATQMGLRDEYPQLTTDDIRAVLAFGAQLASGVFLEVEAG